jgi:hypothetical protein
MSPLKTSNTKKYSNRTSSTPPPPSNNVYIMEFAMGDNKYNIISDKEYLKTYIYFNPKKFVLTEENTQGDIDSLDATKTILDNKKDKFVVDPDPDKEELKVFKSYKYIQRYILNTKTNDNKYLCVGISYYYIKTSFSHVDAVVIIRSSKNPLPIPDVPIFGFALIMFDEKNSISIDVICSDTRTKYTGKFLLEQIQDISKTLGIVQIYLTSVESAIPFYKFNGFIKENELCNNMCLMTKKLIIDSNGGKKGKTNNKSRKTNNKSRKTNNKSRKTRKIGVLEQRVF